MYKLEYLPVARQDLIEIVRYISRELCNPAAAERLAVEITEAGDMIRSFPYADPVYVALRPLKHEYRGRLVRNYMIFYWVDEAERRVTVARVIYARRDYMRLLKEEG